MLEPALSRRQLLRALGAGALGAAVAGPLAACSFGPAPRNLAFSVEDIPYGTDPNQMGELIRPFTELPRPVVVLIHGGYWRLGFTHTEMADLAKDLARVGYASWNIDYRRVGEPGGGWPGTQVDVALAIDKLAELAPDKKLDTLRVAFMGHSAGGQLALWAAGRAKIPSGSPGSNPLVTPKAVVSLSGVPDLAGSARSTLPGGEAELRRAVLDYMGGAPEQVAERYAQSSPLQLIPLGVPQLLLHGSDDDVVSVEQSRDYVAAARAAGDRATLLELPDVDHFAVVKTTKAWWDEVLTWLSDRMGDPTL